MLRKLSVLAIVIASFGANAASVWKVSKGDNTVYIGGTVHVLSASDYPLPREYKEAYDASDSLVFETDMEAVKSLEFQQQSMAMMTFQDGRTFRDVLSPEVSAAVEKHLTSRGIPVEQLLPFKPSLLSITLSVLEFQVIGLTSEGVDQYYSTLALGDGKPVAWLEEPTEQLQFLAGLGQGQENQLIQYTLDEIDTLKPSIDELKDQWRRGDMEAMDKSQLTDMQKDFPAIYNDLIVVRNNNWMPQIEAMFATDEVELVLVGTLHLAGKDSVLASLEKAGYSVEKL